MRFIRPAEFADLLPESRKRDAKRMAATTEVAMHAVQSQQLDQCRRLYVECPNCRLPVSFGKFMKANRCPNCGSAVGDETAGARAFNVMKFLARCDALDYDELLRIFDEIPFAKPQRAA